MLITIAHHKGGVGKTLIALNLAAILKPDQIIDLDAHDTLTTLNTFRSEPLPLIKGNSENIIKLIRDSSDKLVIVDCGGYDSPAIRKVIAASDIVITPVNDEITEVIALAKFDRLLSEIADQVPHKLPTYVLINQVHPSKKAFPEISDFTEKSKNLNLLRTVIRDSKALPNAASFGLGVVEHSSAKYTKSAKNMKELVAEIKHTLSI